MLNLKLSDFNFTLPKTAIATHPAENREEARLMVLDRNTKKISHHVFSDILKFFKEKDSLVINNSKVFPARLYAKKERAGAAIEVFLLRELDAESMLWDTVVEPARKIRIGNKLYFEGVKTKKEYVAEVIDNTTSRGRTIRFFFDGTPEQLRKELFSIGEMPIPKFLGRKAEAIDQDRFQTVYAKELGSVITSASGLHFSKILLKKLEVLGVEIAEITVHANLCSATAIEVEDLSKHKLGAENYIINEAATKAINQSKEEKKRVCAVGTTVLKALESSVSAHDTLKPSSGWTNRFIHPPYDCKIANALITNFYEPCSVPLIAASAFAGHELLMEAYQVALKEQYRFLTYGDAMLII
jgi:S-adenosylmethionine:tRNA ribosyltransferase-isomerase